MRRPVRFFSRAGLLLVEAVLSAVVVAVGLVFITRAFSTDLSALRSAEEYAILTRLAHTALLELELDAHEGNLSERPQEGSFDEPYASYAWGLNITSTQEDELGRVVKVAKLSVSRGESASQVVSVYTVLPAN